VLVLPPGAKKIGKIISDYFAVLTIIFSGVQKITVP